jgi:hypothetical protein
MDICRFSVFWKTPPEKVENRSQVFGLVSKKKKIQMIMVNHSMRGAGWGHEPTR